MMTSIYRPLSIPQSSPIRSETDETFTFPASIDSNAEVSPVKDRPPRVSSFVSIKLASLPPQEAGSTLVTSQLKVPVDKQATVSNEPAIEVQLTFPQSGAYNAPLNGSAASTAARTASQLFPIQHSPSSWGSPFTSQGPEQVTTQFAAFSTSLEHVTMRSPMPNAPTPRAALHQSLMSPASPKSTRCTCIPPFHIEIAIIGFRLSCVSYISPTSSWLQSERHRRAVSGSAPPRAPSAEMGSGARFDPIYCKRALIANYFNHSYQTKRLPFLFFFYNTAHSLFAHVLRLAFLRANYHTNRVESL